MIFNNLSKNNSFILSGFFALFFYIIIILLFFLYLKTSDVKKFDAFTKTTTIELSVIIDNKEKDIVKQSEKKENKKSEEIVKKSKSKTIKQQNNLKSLFANVKDTSKNIVEKEVNNIVKSEVSSRFKAKFEKQRKSEELSVSSILNNVKAKSSVMPSNESNNDTDPYYSKIYEILAQRWNPIILTDGLFAKVLVIISNDGIFDYKFLKYSGNEQFDDSLTSFLNEQVNISYPKHNKGNKTSIEVLFKAKG